MDFKKPISCALTALMVTSAVTPLSLAVEYEQNVKVPVAVHNSTSEAAQSEIAVLHNSKNILTTAAYDAKLAQFGGTAAEKQQTRTTKHCCSSADWWRRRAMTR